MSFLLQIHGKTTFKAFKGLLSFKAEFKIEFLLPGTRLSLDLWQIGGWVQARTQAFRFIDDLNLNNYGGEFEIIYCNICSEQLGLGQELTNKHEANFWNLDIKIRNGKFQVGLFPKLSCNYVESL